jgi:methylase of polypeptide subunit release factors
MSLFPWRGQFSPELIEILLQHYAKSCGSVVDPFVGSGTALFEAARTGLRSFGAEINPAAVEMASTAHFINLRIAQRKAYIQKARVIIDKYITVSAKGSKLFSYECESLKSILSEASYSPFVHNIIANTIIRLMTTQHEEEPFAIFSAFEQHKNIIMQLPYSENPCQVFHCDARNLPLGDKSIDLIVTSPPYINVFNYHQNYRKAMEFLGWDLLAIARSEFGSNRKHRGNRFLTVVQYAIDMLQALCEMARIINTDGRIVIVIGRESKVRGISFRNGQLLAALAIGGAGLNLVLRQERKFKNKFGDLIYEDLLHFAPARRRQTVADDFARCLACYILFEASKSAENEVRKDILLAYESAESIQASPRFQISNIL